MLILITGCGKQIWDYSNERSWVSNEPYVEINYGDMLGYIELDGNITEFKLSFENTGKGVDFYREEISGEDIIWECSCELKDDKLYLTIDKDNVTDKQGETIILEQQEEEE